MLRWLVLCMSLLVASLLLLVIRFLQVIRATHKRSATSNVKKHGQSTQPKRTAGDRCKLVVFLGSGGHTGEMLRLLSPLDFDRYSPRLYVVSSGDSLSLSKAAQLEESKAGKEGARRSSRSDGTAVTGKPASDWTFVEIPRARRVHQSFYTAPFTTLQSFATCLNIFTLPSLGYAGHHRADLILLNGPGSCVPIAVAAFLPRLFGLHSPQLIYVESMARVKRLSLSGRILRLFVDRFFVQWEALADPPDTPVKWYLARKEFEGILV